MKGFVKKLLQLKKNKWWYFILLIISSIYVYQYRYEIYCLESINALGIVFGIWLFLLLFPLISELEFLGVKIKKEVDKATKEVKEDVGEIKKQIAYIQQNNSINNYNYMYGTVPTKDEIKDIKKTDDRLSSSTVDKTTNDAEDDSIYLFKTRLNIESSLRRICDKIGIGQRQSIRTMLSELIRKELLDYETGNLIMKVTSIANRGVHGEIVSDEYIEYVKDKMPQITDQLNSIDSHLFYIVCPKCQYRGYSKYENSCPVCNSVWDDN